MNEEEPMTPQDKEAREYAFWNLRGIAKAVTEMYGRQEGKKASNDSLTTKGGFNEQQ